MPTTNENKLLKIIEAKEVDKDGWVHLQYAELGIELLPALESLELKGLLSRYPQKYVSEDYVRLTKDGHSALAAIDRGTDKA